MKKLFDTHKIDKNLYEIFEGTVEEYKSEEKFDIIIAEGFLHFLQNQSEVVEKIKTLSAENGIVVVTCADEVGLFIETIKRLIAQVLVKDIQDYDSKVDKLTKIFEPQLKFLSGVSRPARDWVQDNLLNPAIVTGNEFTFIDAMKMFGEDYDVLGSSPNMFTDFSWYKNVVFDYKKDFETQYNEKILSFFVAGSPEIKTTEKFGKEIHQLCKEVRELVRKFEESGDNKFVERILEICSVLENKMLEIGESKLSKIFQEAKSSLEEVVFMSRLNFEKYRNFYVSFGRLQHYIAFQKLNSEDKFFMKNEGE